MGFLSSTSPLVRSGQSVDLPSASCSISFLHPADHVQQQAASDATIPDAVGSRSMSYHGAAECTDVSCRDPLWRILSFTTPGLDPCCLCSCHNHSHNMNRASYSGSTFHRGLRNAACRSACVFSGNFPPLSIWVDMICCTFAGA